MSEASVKPRRARDDDTGALLAVESASFATDRLTRRSLRRLITSPTAACLVAEADGEIAGYALVLFRRGSRFARLYSLAVAPHWRGRGVATGLMDAAEAAARSRGVFRLRLEMHEDNAAAAALYRSRGYRPFDRRADYYSDHAAAMRLEKDLAR